MRLRECFCQYFFSRHDFAFDIAWLDGGDFSSLISMETSLPFVLLMDCTTVLYFILTVVQDVMKCEAQWSKRGYFRVVAHYAPFLRQSRRFFGMEMTCWLVTIIFPDLSTHGMNQLILSFQSSRSGNDTGDGSSQSGSNLGFTHSFVATLSVIIVSELGDKTFFIAAIMAMRHSRATVFAGAMSALGVMHVMSAFFG